MPFLFATEGELVVSIQHLMPITPPSFLNG